MIYFWIKSNTFYPASPRSDLALQPLPSAPHSNCLLVSQFKQIMHPCNLWLGLRVTWPMPRASSACFRCQLIHQQIQHGETCIWKSVELFGCTPLQICNNFSFFHGYNLQQPLGWWTPCKLWINKTKAEWIRTRQIPSCMLDQWLRHVNSALPRSRLGCQSGRDAQSGLVWNGSA